MKIKFEIDLPDTSTVGDILSAQGALLAAATGYVDWEDLYNKSADAISVPGLIIFDIARQLGDESNHS